MKRSLILPLAAIMLGASAPVVGATASPPSNAHYVVSTTADTVDTHPGDGHCADSAGDCSLRAAIQESNAGGGPAWVSLGSGKTYKLARSGQGEDLSASGDLDVATTITVNGNGSTVDAAGIDRAFDVSNGGTLRLQDTTVVGGAPGDTESGGAIRSTGSLFVLRSHLRNNAVEGKGASGGAVFNDGGSTMIIDSSITDNSATRAGGGVEAKAGSTQLRNVDLSRNTTGAMPGNGGGLHLTGMGTVHVVGGHVNDNVASAEGGGLWNSGGGTMSVRGTHLTGNEAEGEGADNGGGALYNDGGLLIVTNAHIAMNAATGEKGSGGGILNNAGELRVTSSSIIDNSSNRAGGGVEANEGSTVLNRILLAGNSTGAAPGNGGGLHITGKGSATVLRSDVADNFAASEGGGLWNAKGTMTVSDTLIRDNAAAGDEADQGGGGLFNAGGTLNVYRSRVMNNEATGTAGSGGGLFNDDGTVNIDRTLFSSNTSNRAGGAIEAKAGVTNVRSSSLLSNSTGAAPGNGGGFHLSGPGTVRIDAVDVRKNSASKEGGGLWNSATGTMTATRTNVKGNTAPIGPNNFTQPGGNFTLNGSPVG